MRLLGASFDERTVDDQFRLGVTDLSLPLRLDLSPHGFEVALDPIHSHGKCVNQIEALGVLGQDGRKVPTERHVSIQVQQR
jgi:hypothetical protein